MEGVKSNLGMETSETKIMDVEEKLDSIVWCKEPWGEPIVYEEARELLRQCATAAPEAPASLQQIIDNSNRFPAPFPVDTVRLEKLKLNTPPERLQRNADSTYPLLHERVLVLMANFIVYKRKYGSQIEQDLYATMSIPQLIDRLLLKRALVFIKAQDQYKLVTQEIGVDGWEAVGTAAEKPPLVLANCLSYDEMKLSALVYVSGYTECINDGARYNHAVPSTRGVEREAVIIGVVGPRFKRLNRMDYEDIVVAPHQNRVEHGYGGGGGDSGGGSGSDRRMWRQLWEDFYQLPSTTHSQLSSSPPLECTDQRVFTERWARVYDGVSFDNAVYCRRLQLIVDTVLLEANDRADRAGKFAFLNVIGAGLGVWRMSPHQDAVLALSLAAAARRLLRKGRLPRVADVNLAYIQPGAHVTALFKQEERQGGLFNWVKSFWTPDEDPPKKLFLSEPSHPKGGINIQLQRREPAAALRGQHRGKLLVLTYPWDGNAHPGNEFWLGNLNSSGDPAAACATQVSELHNAHINPAVRGRRTRCHTQEP